MHLFDYLKHLIAARSLFSRKAFSSGREEKRGRAKGDYFSKIITFIAELAINVSCPRVYPCTATYISHHNSHIAYSYCKGVHSLPMHIFVCGLWQQEGEPIVWFSSYHHSQPMLWHLSADVPISFVVAPTSWENLYIRVKLRFGLSILCNPEPRTGQIHLHLISTLLTTS